MIFWELSPGHLKVKRLLGNTLHHGLPLKKNWITYETVATLLESGTREEADQVLRFSTEEDSSNEDSKFLADGSILFFKSENSFSVLIFT